MCFKVYLSRSDFSTVTILNPRICGTRLPQLGATLADKDRIPTATVAVFRLRDSCYKAKGTERRRVGGGVCGSASAYIAPLAEMRTF